jgi:hypothetical protein
VHPKFNEKRWPEQVNEVEGERDMFDPRDRRNESRWMLVRTRGAEESLNDALITIGAIRFSDCQKRYRVGLFHNVAWKRQLLRYPVSGMQLANGPIR